MNSEKADLFSLVKNFVRTRKHGRFVQGNKKLQLDYFD